MQKLIFLILAVVLTTSIVQAQLTLGVRAGFNLTNVSMSSPDYSSNNSNTKWRPGFQVGVVGDWGMSEKFSLQPAILLSTQGYKPDMSFIDDGIYDSYQQSVNLYYVQIPVNAQYKLDIGSMKLLLQAGPYLGFGVYGSEVTKTTIDGKTEKSGGANIFGSEDYMLNMFDFGLGAGVGIEIGKIQAGLGYNLGLKNLYKSDIVKMKNNGIVLTVTYLFGK